MFVTLKIVHLLCLAIAMGMTAANLIMMRYVEGVSGAARSEFGPLGRSFGAYGVMAIVLLWITGIALFLMKYNLSDIDGWFLVKLLFVVVLTSLVISVRTLGAKAIKAQTPPPMEQIKTMTQAIMVLAILTVVAAVIAFV